MSIFAGVVSRKGKPLSGQTCEELARAVSRNPLDQRVVFQDQSAYLVKVDCGAYIEPAFRLDPATLSVSMLAGEPLLEGAGASDGNRESDLETLHNTLDEDDFGALERVTGTFALAYWDPRSSRLVLATDKIGLRPLYCWFGDDYVIFATALRILEQVKQVPKRMDVLGVAEIAGSPSYPANDRTPYADIIRLRPAAMAVVERGTIETRYYWDWRKPLQEDEITEEEALVRTHELFMKSIKRRLKNDKWVPACLSGGLDSRSVVAGLRSLGVEVNTFTYYSALQSQERVFAAQFAQAAGTRHTEMELPIWQSGTTFEQQITEAWHQARNQTAESVARPQLLWTGDGGSVGLGHLLLNPSTVADVRAGRLEQAFTAFKRGGAVSSIVHPKLARTLIDLMVADLREQLEWAACRDAGRAFHLYLILNQQRNDFTEHFEHLDNHRLEFQSPFYDPDFIATVLRLPLDACIGHKFYNKWLRLLPRASEVPWQAYPGHEPCPLPVSQELPSQWDHETKKNDLLRPKLVKDAARMVTFSRFPSPILRKQYLRLATALHWMKVRDCQFALLSLKTYYRYWEVSKGKYVVAAGTGRRYKNQSQTTAPLQVA